MNNTQFYLSVAVGPALTMVVVLIGVLINNNRLNDVNNRISDVNNRISELRSDIGGRLTDLRSEMNSRFNDMREMYRQQGAAQEAKISRTEDMLLGKFAELDTRLSRIESRKD